MTPPCPINAPQANQPASLSTSASTLIVNTLHLDDLHQGATINLKPATSKTARLLSLSVTSRAGDMPVRGHRPESISDQRQRSATISHRHDTARIHTRRLLTQRQQCSRILHVKARVASSHNTEHVMSEVAPSDGPHHHLLRLLLRRDSCCGSCGVGRRSVAVVRRWRSEGLEELLSGLIMRSHLLRYVMSVVVVCLMQSVTSVMGGKLSSKVRLDIVAIGVCAAVNKGRVGRC
jgi:hypothetical protein